MQVANIGYFESGCDNNNWNIVLNMIQESMVRNVGKYLKGVHRDQAGTYACMNACLW